MPNRGQLTQKCRASPLTTMPVNPARIPIRFEFAEDISDTGCVVGTHEIVRSDMLSDSNRDISVHRHSLNRKHDDIK